MKSTATASPSPAHPIIALREHASALEAAITVCLAEATPQAVHKIRTETRRIEALLDLLRLQKGLPSYRQKAVKLLRQLKKLRRAAGRVRDLDVQQKLIEDHEPDYNNKAQREAHKLGQSREQERKRAARKLLKQLAKRQLKIAVRLEAVLKALKPAEDLQLNPTDLLQQVDQHFRGLHALIIRNPSDEHLHSIRKAAKLARYQAELAAGSTTAKRTAKAYKSLQEAGGHWHDWHQLSAIAADELGDKHPATAAFTRFRNRDLGKYRELLEKTREV